MVEVALITFENIKHATEVVVQITAGHIVQAVTVDRDILDVAVDMVSVLDLADQFNQLMKITVLDCKRCLGEQGWLASHGCGVICGLSLLLVLVVAPRVFLRVPRFSLPPQKATFLNSSSIKEQWKSLCKSPSSSSSFVYAVI